MMTGEAVWMTYLQPAMGAAKAAASFRSACVRAHAA
jgi:hypothetical protein